MDNKPGIKLPFMVIGNRADSAQIQKDMFLGQWIACAVYNAGYDENGVLDLSYKPQAFKEVVVQKLVALGKETEQSGIIRGVRNITDDCIAFSIRAALHPFLDNIFPGHMFLLQKYNTQHEMDNNIGMHTFGLPKSSDHPDDIVHVLLVNSGKHLPVSMPDAAAGVFEVTKSDVAKQPLEKRILLNPDIFRQTVMAELQPYKIENGVSDIECGRGYNYMMFSARREVINAMQKTLPMPQFNFFLFDKKGERDRTRKAYLDLMSQKEVENAPHLDA